MFITILVISFCLAFTPLAARRYYGNCDPESCPDGYVCAPPGNDFVANENSQYKCIFCPCNQTSQCFIDVTNELLCNCTGSGTTGEFCEIDIDECANSPCLNGGTCHDGINTYTCECMSGFTGSNCETDIDECANSPCLNGGTCHDGINTYTCECMSGFTGSKCEGSGSTAFVGFTAYLSYFAYDLPIGEPIVLDKVLLNEGNGYDTSTGKFTVPVDGFYSLTFSVETKGTFSNIVVMMVVDGKNLIDAVTETRHGGQNLSGSNAGVFKLTAGQRVWLQPYQEYQQNIEGGDSYRFTTFSGALLSAK